MVQLTDELVEMLDREAGRRAMSRSALIREILTAHFADGFEGRLTQRIVEGYRRVPPASPDEWGLVQETTDVATRELLQRLDAEERREGHPLW